MPCDFFPDIENTGIYLHIPFCAKKCRYCDFYSLPAADRLDAFVKALVKEIELTGALVPGGVDTLYIGGGTPSLLTAGQVTAVLEAARASFHMAPDAEITIEANPDSATRPWMKAVRDAGINRVNIGVQSFDDRTLAFLGRIHSARQAEAALEAARESGFDNIGLDIIYAVPGQTGRAVEKDIETALAFHPEHLSCYMLTYESGTPLTRAMESHEFAPTAEDQAADLFETVCDALTGHGYLHYEISNFAKSPFFMARHNAKYWQRIPYAGLGPSAHSYTGTRRYWNPRDLETCLAALEQDRLPEQDGETLAREQHMLETVYLGLRTAAGVSMDAFNAEFAGRFEDLFMPAITACADLALLETRSNRCVPTRRGMLFHETVAARFADCL
ncbi:MAG: radical SAM family heme chaperone HemW [Thermodesulfobacteriota bacterium]